MKKRLPDTHKRADSVHGHGGARVDSLILSDYYNSEFLHPEDVPVVEFMYLVFTRMPGESYRMRLRSLLLCCVTYFERLCVDS